MKWEDFFETFCTLSDEHKTSRGWLKEYSTKGKLLTIHFHYHEIHLDIDDEETIKNVRFIEHLCEEALCKDRGPIHIITFCRADGSEHYLEMHGNTTYHTVEVTVDEKMEEM